MARTAKSAATVDAVLIRRLLGFSFAPLSLLFGCEPTTAVEPRPKLGGGPGDSAGFEDSGDGGSDTADSDTDTFDTSDTIGAEWTILVYMNGDNDLEAWALADVNEMEVIGSTENVNIVVQLDRSPDYVRDDGDWSGARRYRVEADDSTRTIGSPVLAELGEVDSGIPPTIADFATWGMENFPAERYALVLWDHGTGWNFAGDPERKKAISDDYSSGNQLSVAGGDLTELLAGVTGGVRKLDLLGMDACTMQMWEVAWVVEPYADFMVASQDYEALTGWAYDRFLADLVADPTMDGDELGSSIALRFHEIPDSTQSVLDLSYLPALTSALDDVADAAVESGYARELLWTAATGAQGFDGPYSSDHDVHDLLSRLKAASEDPEVDAAVEAAEIVADAVVVTSYNQGGAVKSAQGLSIYSPAEGLMPPTYSGAPWAAASRWDEFLQAASE